MKDLNKLFILLLLTAMLFACEEDDPEIKRVASLKVVHAVADAPGVYVNYFNEEITFAGYPLVRFGSFERYTLPAEGPTNLIFTYDGDTTRQAFSEAVMLEAGQVATYFLTGDSSSLSSVMVEDVGIATLTDSLNAIRFINMSPDTGPVQIGIADSSVVIAPELAYTNTTEYISFEATSMHPEYTFEFRNADDSVLASYRFVQIIPPFFPGLPPTARALRDNLSLVLVGNPDDGEGNSTLQIIQIDNS